jgi:hypothetical protein
MTTMAMYNPKLQFTQNWCIYRVDASYGGSFLWQNAICSWVPLVQMTMEINMLLDILIGT